MIALIEWMDFFTDPVLRGPTIGSMLMCFSTAIVGVLVYLKKQSLLGEALSHAAYPGIFSGAAVAAALSLDTSDEVLLTVLVLGGACLSALAGLWVILKMEKNLGVRSDSALCFVLSTFFGMGLTLASQMQFTHPMLYRHVQVFLYGQTATMTDLHIYIYGALSLIISLFIFLFYKELQVLLFDKGYAETIGLKKKWGDFCIYFLIVIAIVMGIRSVGVVLLSAMLIAPAVAARQFTHKLYFVFCIAALLGLLSGFLGNYLSWNLSQTLTLYFTGTRLSLPTGPMIVVSASFFCLIALLFAPERGLIRRMFSLLSFKNQCFSENIITGLYRSGPLGRSSFREISSLQHTSTWYLHVILWRLKKKNWVVSPSANQYQLTPKGRSATEKIMSLHLKGTE
jgi:manganese/zinc/iron transport system permease protein